MKAKMKLWPVGMIIALTLGIFGAPLVSKAQQAAKVPRIGAMLSGRPPSAEQYIAAFRLGLRELGYVEGQNIAIDLRWVEVREPQEFESAFAAMTKARAGALIVLADPVFLSHRAQVVDLAAKSWLPAIFNVRQYAEAGGLMAYGPSLVDLFRRAAYFVDRILRGAKPADLPVEQPTRFELVINLKTAQALGLTIPPKLLYQTDKVIR
jgi:putative ABC transport system substrate-binding protein